MVKTLSLAVVALALSASLSAQQPILLGRVSDKPIPGVLTATKDGAAVNQAPVTVYVSSVGASSGFTDPSKDNRDTVKDLRDSLKDAKELRLVESAGDAQIVLTVQSREVAQTTAVIGGEGRDRIIRVRFQAGDLTTELTASALGNTMTSSGAWSKAAGKIAKQVKEWIAANRANLQP